MTEWNYDPAFNGVYSLDANAMRTQYGHKAQLLSALTIRMRGQLIEDRAENQHELWRTSSSILGWTEHGLALDCQSAFDAANRLIALNWNEGPCCDWQD